ncbi:MAG: hypothetical protein ACRCVG_07190 [Methanobacteriaceae archaeon]
MNQKYLIVLISILAIGGISAVSSASPIEYSKVVIPVGKNYVDLDSYTLSYYNGKLKISVEQGSGVSYVKIQTLGFNKLKNFTAQFNLFETIRSYPF